MDFIILVSQDKDCIYFEIESNTFKFLKLKLAILNPVQSISITHETSGVFGEIYGTSILEKQIPIILSGTSNQKLKEIGFLFIKYIDKKSKIILKTIPL